MRRPGLIGREYPFVVHEQEKTGQLSGERVFWGVLIINVAAVALAIMFGDPPAALFDEGGAMTFFSVAQLLMVFGLTRRTFLLRSAQVSNGNIRLRDWRKAHFVWAIIAAGFLYFALDDLLLIHENLDRLAHWVFGLEENALSDRLDDLILVFYGLLGVAVLILYRVELLRFRRPWPYLALCLSLFALTAALDILTNRDDILIGYFHLSERLFHSTEVAEESLKTLAVGAFVGIAYQCREMAKQMISGQHEVSISSNSSSRCLTSARKASAPDCW